MKFDIEIKFPKIRLHLEIEYLKYGYNFVLITSHLFFIMSYDFPLTKKGHRWICQPTQPFVWNKSEKCKYKNCLIRKILSPFVSTMGFFTRFHEKLKSKQSLVYPLWALEFQLQWTKMASIWWKNWNALFKVFIEPFVMSTPLRWPLCLELAMKLLLAEGLLFSWELIINKKYIYISNNERLCYIISYPALMPNWHSRRLAGGFTSRSRGVDSGGWVDSLLC